MHSITYNTGRESPEQLTCSAAHGKEVCIPVYNVSELVVCAAFRVLPFPLEQGHRHEPYPASTTILDKEILPGESISTMC